MRNLAKTLPVLLRQSKSDSRGVRILLNLLVPAPRVELGTY
jgi:hypothetical protein